MEGAPLPQMAPSTIPTDYIALLAETLQPYGISTAQLLAGSRVDVASFDDYCHKTNLQDFIVLVDRAVALSEDPALGLQFGRCMSFSSHGMLGVAASNQSTVGDAMDVLLAYARSRVDFYRIKASSSDGMIHIELGIAPLPERFSRFMVEAFLAFVLTQLSAAASSKVTIGVTWQAVPWSSVYLERLATPVKFSRRANIISFPASLLRRKIGKTNRALAKMALEHCRQQLESNTQDYRSVVTRMIRTSPDKMISRECIAEKLNISGSTLSRRLAIEGTDFTTLSGQVRFEAACDYLLNTRKSIQEIADLLGYQDTSNFGRLFRGHAGCSPSAYRKRHRLSGC